MLLPFRTTDRVHQKGEEYDKNFKNQISKIKMTIQKSKLTKSIKIKSQISFGLHNFAFYILKFELDATERGKYG